jgi:hypothetical protein
MAAERFVVLGLAPARSNWFRSVGLWANSGALPADAEIIPFWRSLIDTNRHELAHADDPDLVFPGQVFVVPAP